VFAKLFKIAGRKPRFNLQIATIVPAGFSQPLKKRCKTALDLWIVRGKIQKYANAAYALLRAGDNWPCGYRTAENAKKFPPPHVRPWAPEKPS
jgi:hypothetical protein